MTAQNTKTTPSSSTLSLTGFGHRISDFAKVKAWSRQNAANMTDKAKGREEPEISNMCLNYVKHCYDKDEEFNRKIRSLACHYGTEIKQVLAVYQIELKNRLV